MSFPFEEMATAIRDKAIGQKASFPGGAFPGNRPISLDDAWVTSMLAGNVASKCPAIYVEVAEWSGQKDGERCRLDGESVILATWVDTIERYEKSSSNISQVMSWLCGLAFEEDLQLSTFTPPDDNVMLLECFPAFARNYKDLQELGIVGAQVGFRFRKAHFYET